VYTQLVGVISNDS